MKQTVLLLLLTLATSLSAQIDVSFAPQRGEVIGTADAADVESRIILTNPTNRTLRLGWSVDLDGLPVDWQGWVCGPNRCYTPFTYTSPAEAPVVIQPGESVVLSAHVRPNERAGNGFFNIHLVDLNRPSEAVQTLEYGFEIQDARAFDRAGAVRVRMYPNPTTNFVQLENDQMVDQIHVYNIIGRKILSFERQAGKRYDLTRLPGGMYMVSLVNNDHGVLRTIRLSKQIVRP